MPEHMQNMTLCGKASTFERPPQMFAQRQRTSSQGQARAPWIAQLSMTVAAASVRNVTGT